jgi:hypothetical protein
VRASKLIPLLMSRWKSIPACSALAFRIPVNSAAAGVVEQAEGEVVAVHTRRDHDGRQRRHEGPDLTQRDHLAYQET